MSGETPRRPEREDLPGSAPAGEPGRPESGWLAPTDAEPGTDPFGRPWERKETDAEPAPAAGAPVAWPGAQQAPAPSTASWPGGGASAQASLPAGMRVAGFGSRAQAAVVDFFVRLALLLAFGLLGALLFLAGETAGVVGSVLGLIAGFVAGLAYAPIMMSRTGGQTVGHKASGTRIVHRDGRPVVGGQAVLREVVVKWLLIDAVGGSFLLPALLNYLWALWDADNDALHDKLLKTRVVEA